ncbi:GNAT family N-acetyltransferase [Avibacterium paragallinarum]|uniref:N-acetyltransferase n=1 Tax=Avibacterium paragallinarum TaxID=728 RepID=A0A0F5F347_AVIPA|nr:GNAT family N-acetyltransferase [Avibacterium paragallinarum]KAA6209858.1 N-acetyltransferase [Avibacterium paragallinarum]KKB02602.1 acetyltransferase [Avibacterium paragallinarum]RZN56752.1 N-acetyltransferase [Avibacterium paragallinarum]RZN61506.1 N-acetyltransferase [Avibacterium paragallinarum]RZN73427.1 N-acetyltransferase [Avibacterium paragallinarum]
MRIQHQQNQQDGEFFILDEQGQKVAKLTYYFIDEHRINANHTYVSEALRGQGVADKLYQALVKFVREKQLILEPTCSYIAKKWQRELK